MTSDSNGWRQRLDRLSLESRSPELALRKALWVDGTRGYRIHPRAMQGKPDLAFTRARIAVFVDGCFWHGCPTCYRAPSSNREYWEGKLLANRARDQRVTLHLESEGWEVMRFWEHEIEHDLERCVRQVQNGLERRATH